MFRRITTLCKYGNTFQHLLLSNTTYTLLYFFFQNYFCKFYSKHPRCILFNLFFLLSNKHLNTVSIIYLLLTSKQDFYHSAAPPLLGSPRFYWTLDLGESWWQPSPIPFSQYSLLSDRGIWLFLLLLHPSFNLGLESMKEQGCLIFKSRACLDLIQKFQNL